MISKSAPASAQAARRQAHAPGDACRFPRRHRRPGLVGVLIVVFGLAMAYPNLPDLDTLTDYRPKMPLRMFSADNVLIGEFGEERRNLVRIKDIPDVMKKAVLAVEDDRFYEHGGIDYMGIMRAAVNNATGGARQGASTITQQVARNFFLSSEQTLKRKAYEVLLAWKIEQNLTKDQILEVYMNQIYLGQRAFGFASAAQIYFGKQLKDITAAEAAMLAGLPKAPSAYNPVVNPKRAHAPAAHPAAHAPLGYLTDPQFETAKNEALASRPTAASSACTPNTWPKWRARWSMTSSRKRPTRAA